MQVPSLANDKLVTAQDDLYPGHELTEDIWLHNLPSSWNKMTYKINKVKKITFILTRRQFSNIQKIWFDIQKLRSSNIYLRRSCNSTQTGCRMRHIGQQPSTAADRPQKVSSTSPRMPVMPVHVCTNSHELAVLKDAGCFTIYKSQRALFVRLCGAAHRVGALHNVKRRVQSVLYFMMRV